MPRSKGIESGRKGRAHYLPAKQVHHLPTLPRPLTQVLEQHLTRNPQGGTPIRFTNIERNQYNSTLPISALGVGVTADAIRSEFHFDKNNKEWFQAPTLNYINQKKLQAQKPLPLVMPERELVLKDPAAAPEEGLEARVALAKLSVLSHPFVQMLHTLDRCMDQVPDIHVVGRLRGASDELANIWSQAMETMAGAIQHATATAEKERARTQATHSELTQKILQNRQLQIDKSHASSLIEELQAELAEAKRALGSKSKSEHKSKRKSRRGRAAMLKA
eukprot:CAMPEP_0118942668 /NCGR_PEP_ID=MMETSP1169-20130426/36604_1 /TAXON_ID=36882 /ORGANISM="Pyramimonas obovata, Strain CCMP722" /LENGTH=275 /DNA_ID=CAMNT_0006887723 /DNA_START=209 /DNA_END=1032 /DNA_ORIENTATION=+